jgi:hypothetical protein
VAWAGAPQIGIRPQGDADSSAESLLSVGELGECQPPSGYVLPWHQQPTSLLSRDFYPRIQLRISKNFLVVSEEKIAYGERRERREVP